MKLTQVLTLAIIAGAFWGAHRIAKRSQAQEEANTILNEFANFVETYGKTYGSEDEIDYRLEVFKSNYLKIQEHNAKGLEWTLAVNQFADMTNEEFKTKMLTLKVSNRTRDVADFDLSAVPTSVDWRKQGIINPVKDQGQCGSCWAFSAVAALEGLYAQKTGSLLSFSEQQLVDCSRTQGNQGCNGGLMDYAFKYASLNGLEQEKDYPYRAVDQSCKEVKSKDIKINIGFKDVTANSVAALQAAIAQQVVSVAVEADTDFQFYSSGVVTSESCGTQLDHGVTAVGYDASAASPYWIVRNSWGSSWGENGYIRIGIKSTNRAGICGILADPSYPTA